jgi:putative ABC transport system permease protein
VGVRKVLGAGRMDLIRQFIGESLVITVFSTLLALVVTELLLPFFNGILNTSLEISFLHNPIFNVGLVLMIMLVSLVSGFYPAFYLSRFQPLQVLKGTGLQKGRTSAWLNKVLVVVQFMVAIGMIFSIVVLNRQFNYVQNKDKGINYDNKAYIPFRQQKAVEKLDIIKTELLQNPQIEEVSGAADINGVSGSQGPVYSDDSSHTRVTSRYGFVDYNFFDMMEIPIKQGRNFSKDFATDKTLAAIVNEAMVQAFGWKEPIGQKIMLYNDGDSSLRYTVVGVISDYHYYSLRNKIEPATYLIEPERYQGVVVKMTQDADDEITKKLMGFIEEKWKTVYPNSPYAGQLVSERLQRSLQQDQNDLKMFFFFTLLAILISCLGLFGLVSLTVEQRTREIGIRKAMGGSTGMIAGHMLKEFIKLVLLAGLFSAPIAWYFSNRLLDEFVYRIHISLFDFLLALLLGVFIALVATGFRALAAARSNPVDALKYE